MCERHDFCLPILYCVKASIDLLWNVLTELSRDLLLYVEILLPKYRTWESGIAYWFSLTWCCSKAWAIEITISLSSTRHFAPDLTFAAASILNALKDLAAFSTINICWMMVPRTSTNHLQLPNVRFSAANTFLSDERKSNSSQFGALNRMNSWAIANGASYSTANVDGNTTRVKQ